MSHTKSHRAPDEETSLLSDGNLEPKETPLPLAQILVLLLLQLCEPITSQSIKPYINQVCSVISVICYTMFVTSVVACQ